MVRWRRAVGPIAAAWLSCQLSLLVLTPVVMAIGAEEQLECRCQHGDHAVCPMHHKRAPGSQICLMRGTSDSAVAVLRSLFGPMGLLPAPTAIGVPVPVGVVAVAEPGTTSLPPAPPDPPPPRA